MLNGIFQRPYLTKDTKTLVRKKQDDENTSSAQKESSQNRGLEYKENYNSKEQEVDWRQMRSQIQAQVKDVKTDNIQKPTKDLSGTNPIINIAQILKDFKNTAEAIGTPDNLKEEVNGYLSLIETQVYKDNPNTKLIKSNLKNASTILDNYISETLNKDSKVVENWVDALFLQQIDFKYNENEINPQFLVKFPKGSVKDDVNSAKENVEIVEESVDPVKIEKQTNSFIPQDKELKSLFIQSKKLSYANKPEKAIQSFQKAMKRANEIGDKETKSKIYFEVGKIYDDNSLLTEALNSYNKSIKTTSDNNIKTKAHYSMAQIYDDVNQIEPALEHYFNSVSFAGEAENLPLQATSLSKMGNIFTDLYDNEALNYFKAAEEIAVQTDNVKVKGYVSSNFGDAYEVFGEPQKALKSYSNAVKYYSETDSPLKTAQNYTKAADLMVSFSNINKAKNLLSKAQNYANQTEDFSLLNEINDKLNSLQLLG